MICVYEMSTNAIASPLLTLLYFSLSPFLLSI